MKGVKRIVKDVDKDEGTAVALNYNEEPDSWCGSANLKKYSTWR